jgi:hypothetical protein
VQQVTIAASVTTTSTRLWKVRRQTTNGPGGLVEKGTKDKRAGERLISGLHRYVGGVGLNGCTSCLPCSITM